MSRAEKSISEKANFASQRTPLGQQRRKMALPDCCQFKRCLISAQHIATFVAEKRRKKRNFGLHGGETLIDFFSRKLWNKKLNSTFVFWATFTRIFLPFQARFEHTLSFAQEVFWCLLEHKKRKNKIAQKMHKIRPSQNCLNSSILPV